MAQLDVKSQSFARELEAACARQVRQLQKHRERFVKAYCAAYGIDTRERLAELCLVSQQDLGGITRLWIERRQ